MNSERNQSIDIAKGILIILVVLGHSEADFHKYIYWFHMPAFFMITGSLLRKNYLKSEIKNLIIQKGQKYGRTYISYFIIIILIKYLWFGFDEDYNKSFFQLLYGGRLLVEEFGVFWFITCLFFSQIYFALIYTFIQSPYIRTALFIILYLIAHFQSNYFSHIFFPWSADTAFIAAFYMFLGKHFQEVINWINRSKTVSIIIILLCVAVGSFLIHQDMIGNFTYVLDLKYNNYQKIILDVLFPTLFFTSLILISSLLKEIYLTTFFAYIGLHSIIIMYLHLLIKEIYQTYYGSNWIFITLLGCLIPLALSIFFKKWHFTRKFLLTY